MKNKKAVLCALVLFFIAIASCSALFFKSSGCGAGSTFTTGEHKIISNGIERVFYVKLPENYNPNTSIRSFSASTDLPVTIRFSLKETLTCRRLWAMKPF